MNTTAPPLKLRVYAGRENGLMIIGQPESLWELGQRLQAVGEGNAPGQDGWPAEVAVPRTESPYLDVPEFKVSFHTEPPSGLPASLPLRRRNLSPIAFLVLGALAVVGAGTIIRWIVAHAL
jgi:hypothetical protein